MEIFLRLPAQTDAATRLGVRKSLLILLLVELVVVVALGQIVHVDRPAMAWAWLEWRQRPTLETREAFERQKRITEGVRWGFAGAAFVALAGATIVAYRLRSTQPQRTQRAQR